MRRLRTPSRRPVVTNHRHRTSADSPHRHKHSQLCCAAVTVSTPTRHAPDPPPPTSASSSAGLAAAYGEAQPAAPPHLDRRHRSTEERRIRQGHRIRPPPTLDRGSPPLLALQDLATDPSSQHRARAARSAAPRNLAPFLLPRPPLPCGSLDASVARRLTFGPPADQGDHRRSPAAISRAGFALLAKSGRGREDRWRGAAAAAVRLSPPESPTRGRRGKKGSGRQHFDWGKKY